MTKFRYLLVVAFIGLIVACGGDGGSTVDNFDHASQSVIDNDSLVSFFKKHYFDVATDSVKPLIDGETALFDDENLKIQEVTETINEEDIDFTLYYYVINEGVNDDKGYPSVVDSVFVNYSGQRVVRTDSLSVSNFDANNRLWFALSGVIRGWSYGFTHFKGGVNVTGNGPITYENPGKGILFIPSGLAYRNVGSGSILPNEPLMFYIELLDLVPETDIDGDGVPSIYEDIDGDGKPWNDDTDGDFSANMFDGDDDGDLILTRFEDANNDGDPRNDFSDPDNPTLPDYLNRNIRVSNQ